MDDVREYIRKELERRLKEELENGPWFCIMCGVGGNFEGGLPDAYWFPPEDHVCIFKET